MSNLVCCIGYNLRRQDGVTESLSWYLLLTLDKICRFDGPLWAASHNLIYEGRALAGSYLSSAVVFFGLMGFIRRSYYTYKDNASVENSIRGERGKNNLSVPASRYITPPRSGFITARGNKRKWNSLGGAAIMAIETIWCCCSTNAIKCKGKHSARVLQWGKGKSWFICQMESCGLQQVHNIASAYGTNQFPSHLSNKNLADAWQQTNIFHWYVNRSTPEKCLMSVFRLSQTIAAECIRMRSLYQVLPKSSRNHKKSKKSNYFWWEI